MYGLKDLRNLDKKLVVPFLQNLNGFRPTWDTDINRDIVFDLYSGYSISSICELHNITTGACNVVINNYTWWLSLSEDDKKLFSLGDNMRVFNAFKRQGFKTVEDVVSYYQLYGNFSNIHNLGKKSEIEVVKRLITMGYDVEVPTYSSHDDSTLCVIYDKKENQYLNCNGTLGSLSMAKVFNDKASAYDYIKCYMDFTSTEVRGVSLRLK